MTKDEIQFWMLLAFAVAFVFSAYKVYIIFDTPTEGIDTPTQHKELEKIIIEFLKQHDVLDIDSAELFARIKTLEGLQDGAYHNFNENRFNQLLQKLFYTYNVGSLEELIVSVKEDG